MKPLLRTLALAVPLIGGFSSCEFDEDFLGGPEPAVVYVQEPQRPVYFDPYYNRPKVYYNDPVLFKSTEKKTKGNKIYKTTTIRNQYGNTVYKETTSQNKKKKKKK